MSRTIRFDKKQKCLVPDGKVWYKCKCDYCISKHKTKFYERIAKQEIAQTD